MLAKLFQVMPQSIRFLIVLLFHLAVSIAEATSLFNLTGSVHGFGDVVGPYLLSKRMVESGETVYVLLDARAERVLKTFLETPGELVSREGIHFVRLEDLPELPKIDRLFEVFLGARSATGTNVDVRPYLRWQPETIIEAQDLHSPFGRPRFPLDLLATGVSQIKTSRGSLQFSAAGLGRERLGILVDKSVDRYVGKTLEERRALAAEVFGESSLIRELIQRTTHAEAKLGFAYGIHNEVFESEVWKPYPGQFASYLEGVKAIAQESGAPVILLSPNDRGALDKARGTVDAKILGLEDLAHLKSLKKKEVYVVATGPISNRQFVALTAVSDIPYLIEGDSSLSAAVRLGKPFAMLKGPWGLFGIDGLSRALSEAGATWAPTVYPIRDQQGTDAPNFSSLPQMARDTAVFSKLKANANDWAQSLLTIVALAEGRKNPVDVFAVIRDPLLRYSYETRFGKTTALRESEYFESILAAKSRLSCRAAFH